MCEPRKYYGKGNLSRLDEGFLQINIEQWPTDVEAGTQYNILELFGDLPPEHRDTMEAFAYQLHHMSQQALIHFEFFWFEDESVGLNGEDGEQMFLPSDSD